MGSKNKFARNIQISTDSLKVKSLSVFAAILLQMK